MIDIHKQKLFCFFCEYLNENSESFDMWRLNGDDEKGLVI